MSAPLLGRVVGEKIELDVPITRLDGKRIRVTVEVVDSEAADDEPAALRAWRDAPLDEAPITSEERASIEVAKATTERWHTTAEVRAKLALRKRDEPGE